MGIWPFKSVETLKASGMFQGFTDWHSHILPGVDDGIKTIEDSLDVLRAYEELGFRKVWLTPHIMEDYPNETADLRRRFDELRNAWTGNVELDLAAENMLDMMFERRLEKSDFLPIGKDRNHLLVETSYYTPPFDMDSIVDAAMSKGYFLILAHPERYRYMDKNDYRKWKSKGLKFQTNFMSVVGGYGDTARQKAEWLLQEGLVDFTGSDVHRLDAVAAMIEKSPKKRDTLERLREVALNPAIE